ncbi:hypothetical protein BSKO_05480 [Bryopsis sp. KO-2023]|nr:hypothetical protein BSKO_05480 [Bryopsis sp. KO-2023]
MGNVGHPRHWHQNSQGLQYPSMIVEKVHLAKDMPRSPTAYTTTDVDSVARASESGVGLDVESNPFLPGREFFLDTRKSRSFPVSVEVISGCCYCGTSVGMVLLNKAVLSSFDFHAPNSLLFFQCAMALVMICACRALGWVSTDPIDWRVVKLWCPVNLIFVGMVWTSFYSLKNLGVAMVTLLKNTTNFLVITGDLVLFGKRYNGGVWGAVCLILLSSMVGGATDLSFSLVGYTWQLLNCCFSAGYSLYLKLVMEKISTITGKPKGMEESTMVLYNNGLALPWILLLMFYFGETESVWKQPALYDSTFQLAAIVSGVLGFMISFASLWFLANTAATNYSLVGSLNKLPTAILGMLLFNTPMTTSNVLSVLVGLAAGVLFVAAKSRNGKS